MVQDCSWPRGEATVLRLVDDRETSFVLKVLAGEQRFDQEEGAYREWVPALGTRAPRLVASARELRALLLTFVPGELTDGHDKEVHRQAGTLIRAYHNAAPPVPAPDLPELLLSRLDRQLARGGQLFSRTQIDAVRRGLIELSTIRELMSVPLHLDNQPRNWLVDAAGVVRLIDFTLSRPGLWVQDLVRLAYGAWREDPELGEAFLDGYGTSLDDTDREIMRRCAAAQAMSAVVWGHEYDEPTFAAHWSAVLRSLHSE